MSEELNHSIYQIPNQGFQTFLGLIDAKLGVYLQTLLPKYKAYQEIFTESRTILYSESAQLIPLQAEKDRLEVSLHSYPFEGPSNLFEGIKGAIEFLKNGECHREIILFLSLQSFEEDLDYNLSQQLAKFIQTTSAFKIRLYVLSFGVILPTQTLDLIRNVFQVDSSTAVISQIQVDPTQKTYSEVLNKKFLRIENSLNKCVYRFKDLSNKKPLFINSPFILLEGAEKLDITNGEQRLSVEPLKQISYTELNALCMYLKSNLIKQRKSNQSLDQEIDSTQKMLRLLERKFIGEGQKNEEFEQNYNDLYKLDLKSFNTQSGGGLNNQQIKITTIDELAQYALTKHDLQVATRELAQELKTVLDQNELDVDNSDQGRSAVNFVNQKDILGDEEYLTILQQTPQAKEISQYFPIVGQGLKISTRQKTNSSCWSIKLDLVAIVNSVHDTASIFMSKQGDFLRFNGEDVNCVLPLYGQNDKDLKFFLRSKLYDSIMSMMVTRSADIIQPECHALLSALYFLFLTRRNKSTFRDEQIELIYQTFQLKYEDFPHYESLKNSLLSNKPEEAFLKPLSPYETTPPLLIVILLLVLSKEKGEQLKGNIDRIFELLLVSVYSEFSWDNFKLYEDQVKPINFEVLTNTIVDLIPNELTTVYDIQQEMVQLCETFNFGPFLTNPEIKPTPVGSDSPLDFNILNSLYKYLTEGELKPQLQLRIQSKISKSNNLRQMFVSPLDSGETFIAEIKQRHFKNEKNFLDLYRNIMAKILLKRPELKNSMAPAPKRHHTELEEEISFKGMETKLFKIRNGTSGHILNSCTCQDCYFYLRPFDITKYYVCSCKEFQESTEETNIIQQWDEQLGLIDIFG